MQVAAQLILVLLGLGIVLLIVGIIFQEIYRWIDFKRIGCGLGLLGILIVFLGLLATAEGDKDGPKMFLGGLGLLVLTWLFIPSLIGKEEQTLVFNTLA
jgi:hypothetical protein